MIRKVPVDLLEDSAMQNNVELVTKNGPEIDLHYTGTPALNWANPCIYHFSFVQVPYQYSTLVP